MNPIRLESLKEIQRKHFSNVLNEICKNELRLRLGVRINSITSSYFKDIEAIPRNSIIHSIIVPKVDKKSDINKVILALKKRLVIIIYLLSVKLRFSVIRFFTIIQNVRIKHIFYSILFLVLKITSSNPFFHLSSINCQNIIPPK